MREAMTKKIMVLGVDGFDPKFAKYLMDQGKMPNLQQFVKRGSAREDLVMLGATVFSRASCAIYLRVEIFSFAVTTVSQSAIPTPKFIAAG